MAKRRLTKRQQSTIRRRQESLIDAAAHPEGDLQRGRAIARIGKTLMVEDDELQLHRCSVRQNLGAVVCGDDVVWEPTTSGEGVVAAIQPRKNLLTRPDRYGKAKAVAANIDVLLVVNAAKPALDTHLLDHYLVATELLAVEAVIVFNKMDLCSETELKTVRQQLRIYEQLGYPVQYTDAKQRRGVNELEAQLNGKTGIVVGLSGVGKSSLIKALLPDAELRIGQISAASGLGRHTTTSAQLFHLPSGGDIIDSPGVREFGLWQTDAKHIAQGFTEFHPYLGRCRFRDCLHVDEPGCAIAEAAEAGEINSIRLQSYRRMLAAVISQGSKK